MKRTILLFLLIYSAQTIVFSQNNCTGYEELNRKRHKIEGGMYGHPYTTFDRKNGYAFDETIDRIRKKIKNSPSSDPIVDVYRALYNSANTSINTHNDDGLINTTGGSNNYSQMAQWAKNNAFVFLIGLDGNGNYLDSTDPTGATRNAFKNRALEGFENLSGHIPGIHNWFNQFDMDDMQNWGRSLMLWLQCYDMLKASAALPELVNSSRNYYNNFDSDKNKSKCSPRNKLRALMRDFYINCKGSGGIVEHWTGWKKNHGIKAASCLLMGAQVLNDAGVETNYLKGIFGFLWFDYKTPRPNYSPINWNKLGLDGLYENLFVGHHVLSRDVPQSPINTEANSYSVYAEGPGYLRYGLLESGIPAMRAQANYYPAWSDKVLLNKPEIKNVFNWYYNLISNDGYITSFDNTRNYTCNILTLTGNSDYNLGTTNGITLQHAADFIAIVAGNNMQVFTKEIKRLENMELAGNIMLNDTANNKKFKLVGLFESGQAVDKGANPITESETHEEHDFGTFMMFGNTTPLAIDPQYFGWGQRGLVNKFEHHNHLYFGTSNFSNQRFKDGVAYKPNSKMIVQYPNGFKLSYHVVLSNSFNSSGLSDFFNNILNGNPSNSFSVGKLQREFRSYKMANGELYYIINDKGASNQTELRSLVFKLNGAGSTENGTFTHNQATSISIWNGLCPSSRLIHHFAVSGSPQYQVNLIEGRSALLSNTKHTALEIYRSSDNAVIQSTLLPSSCDLSQKVPRIAKFEGSNYVYTLIESEGKVDTITARLGKNSIDTALMPNNRVFDMHFCQLDNINQTINDPYKLNLTNIDLKIKAVAAYLSMGSFEKNSPGVCACVIKKFRSAEIYQGEKLSLNDTDYISATGEVNAQISFISKFKYNAFIHPIDTNVKVSFYLSDHELSYKMIAKKDGKIIPSEYNDTTGVFSIIVNEPTSFTIEIFDPCLASCYFPVTNEPIDTTMYFDTGNLEALGHDLDIIPDKGELFIIKGSKMSICPDFIFANKDSLILHSNYNSLLKPVKNIFDGPITTDRPVLQRLQTKRSMIIVNDKAALVLDSGSFTHVGDNATILVLKGGTLLIKKGAVVEIGGNEVKNDKAFGEIIAEEGAFVCIEDSSTIYFFKDSLANDSVDNNVFYVSLDKLNPTIAGTNPLGGRGKFLNSPDAPGIYANSNCLAFCNVKNVLPPYGIQNRDWGWCNFSRPKIKAIVPEVVCNTEEIYLSPNKILNESWYKINIKKNGLTIFEQESNFDSIQFSGLRLPPLASNESYLLNLYIKNDCGEGDTLIQTVSVPDAPKPLFTMPKMGCEGSENLLANGGSSIINQTGLFNYLWFVNRLIPLIHNDDTSYLIDEDYNMEWMCENKLTIDTSFNFPGFKWVGGYKYTVGLTILGKCQVGTFLDTINIPFGVNVNASSILSSHQLLGNPSIQLTGTGSQPITTFTWSNAGKLLNSHTLTPQTNTTDSITTYVLAASNGHCTASDTIHVKYNNYLFMGNDTITCKGTALLLGNRLEESLLFGLLGTIDLNTFENYFDNYTSADPLFSKHFGVALLANNHYLWNKLQTNHKAFFDIINDYKDSFYRNASYVSVYTNYLNQPLNSYMQTFKNDFIQNNSNLSNLIAKRVGNYNNANGFLAFENLLLTVFDNLMRDYRNYGIPVGNAIWYVNGVEQTVLENQLLTNNIYDTTTHLGVLLNMGNTVEYDEVIVNVDSTMYPQFMVAFVHDSTVYFNVTPNAPPHLSYHWNFGDNATADVKNPVHTFAEFNKTYYVCVTVTNLCNAYTFCDSLSIDSNLSNLFLGKRSSVVIKNSPSTSEEKPVEAIINVAQEIYLGNNIPNPFDESTEINYEVNKPVTNLKLVVTNSLGQQKLIVPLQQNIGKVFIHKHQLDKGVYYYYLNVNGVNTPAKLMLVK